MFLLIWANTRPHSFGPSRLVLAPNGKWVEFLGADYGWPCLAASGWFNKDTGRFDGFDEFNWLGLIGDILTGLVILVATIFVSSRFPRTRCRPNQNAVPGTEKQPLASPTRLRWFQYRRRSLFILTMLVALASSWLGLTIRQQQSQYAAAEALQKGGAIVRYEQTLLGTLLRDYSMVSVSGVVFWCEQTDPPPGYEYAIWRSDAAPPPATDNMLVYLRELRQLRCLCLDGSQITDAGLACLEGLGQLESLRLSNTKVTDAGLVHLQGLDQLQTLWLGCTKVTDEGVKKLQQALPKCKIER
jgi:hypothetical protein